MSNRLDSSATPSSGKRSRAVLVAATLIGVEAIAIVVVAGTLLIDLFTLRPDSYSSAVALTVLAIIAAIWMIAVAIAFWKGRQWSRAASLTWQVLQIAIAIGAFQGVFAQPGIGWALLAPAVIVIVLLMTRSVIEHSQPREHTDD